METEEHYEKLTKEEIETCLKNGMLEEIFLEAPSENKDVVLKISFPVTKK